MCPFLGILFLILQRFHSASLCYPSPDPSTPSGNRTPPPPPLSSKTRAVRSTLLLARRRAALGALGSILRTALLAVRDAYRIQRAAHHVIADARQILHAAAADEHNRVLLQVVADAGDVGRDLDAVGQAHASHLAQGRVRLLRCLRIHAGAHT